MRVILSLVLACCVVGMASAEEETFSDRFWGWSSMRTITTHERTWAEHGHVYVVSYRVERPGMSIPLTNLPGGVHYDASITVFRVVEGRHQRVASFDGQYTDEGCFEDDPKALVQWALELEARHP